MARKNTKGKSFEKEWAKGMDISRKELGATTFNHRYYDLQDYVGKNCPKCKKSLDTCGHCGAILPISKSRPPRQPGDYFSLYKGVAVLQELKSSYNEHHFPLWYGNKPTVKPHQVQSLLNCKYAGGEGFLIINRRKVPHSRRMPVYVIDIIDFCNHISRANHKWIEWPVIEEMSIITVPRVKPRGSQAYYDHTVFLKSTIDYHNKSKPIKTQWGSLTAIGTEHTHTKQTFQIQFNKPQQANNRPIGK